MRMALADAGRYARTVRHLRPAQVVHRVRLRTQQAALRRYSQLFVNRWRFPDARGSWPESFTAVDERCPPFCGPVEDLLQDRFTFLNVPYSLGQPARWDPPGMSQLWLYHHHYWEWAWTLVTHPDRVAAREAFARQVSSWLDHARFGLWNAWAPYPTSLRTWVLLNVAGPLGSDTPIADRLHSSLREHAGFVAHNLELDVGGNHLIKNLKALVGVGVYFDDARALRKATDHLADQIERQILGDGGHFERSPSYHAQVLADLIDIDALLTSSGHEVPAGLPESISRMRRWIGALRMPDGDVPVMNDGERVGPRRLDTLEPGSQPEGSLTVLPESGYIVARTRRLWLVADAGEPCPPDLPAHAQADCLSFELALDGSRLIVDPGTSEYGSGPQRQWERSTAAHNTVSIDGHDQTEVWGGFRAGRRAHATIERTEVHGDRIVITASHDGFRFLPGAPRHRRTWLLEDDKLVIRDEFLGQKRHTFSSRLLFSSSELAASAARRLSVSTSSHDPVSITTVPASYATGHGQVHRSAAIQVQLEAEAPMTLETRLHLSDLGGYP